MTGTRVKLPCVAAVILVAGGAICGPGEAAAADCQDLWRLAQQTWGYFRSSGDPYHRAAAQNYENGYRACLARPSQSRGPGLVAPSSGAGKATAVLSGVLGMLQMIEQLTSRDTASAGQPDPGDRARAEAQGRREALARQQAALAREQAEDSRRRAGLTNPWGAVGTGCDASQNPFCTGQRGSDNPFARPSTGSPFTEGGAPDYDSVTGRTCTTVDLSQRNACIPAQWRSAFRALADGLTPQTLAQREDPQSLVLSVEDYLRIADGVSREQILAERAGPARAAGPVRPREIARAMEPLLARGLALSGPRRAPVARAPSGPPPALTGTPMDAPAAVRHGTVTADSDPWVAACRRENPTGDPLFISVNCDEAAKRLEPRVRALLDAHASTAKPPGVPVSRPEPVGGRSQGGDRPADGALSTLSDDQADATDESWPERLRPALRWLRAALNARSKDMDAVWRCLSTLWWAPCEAALIQEIGRAGLQLAE